MTSTLPQAAQEVFQRFITTELTTVDARRQPITWPVTPYYRPGAATIDTTTGVGYPKKADDAKRHPSVSLLFSDPTGSGLARPPQVLVQGTAEVDEANIEANKERYFRESGEKLPKTKKMHPPKPIRKVIDWYYVRLYICVRPERVFIWPGGDATQEPEVLDCHMEEVRSGHTEEPPEPHGDPAHGEPVWDERVDKMGEQDETAVISWLAPDGFPLSVRLPILVDSAAREIRLEAEPAGIPLTEGRAALTAHAHHPDFLWQRNFQVRGNLKRDASGWSITPRRLVGGFELPEGRLAANREFFKRTRQYRRKAKQRLAEIRSS